MEDEFDLREIVYSELRPVAAGLRSPESDQYARNAPSPELIEFVGVKVLIPIFTSLVSGLITRRLAASREKESAAKIESQFSDLRARLGRISSAMNLDGDLENDFESVVVEMTRIRTLEPGLLPEPTDALEAEITSILRRYHIPAVTARARASAIVARILRQ